MILIVKNPKRPYCKCYFSFNLATSVVLGYSEYEDFDKEYYNQPALFFKVNKSFLRKNKDIILTKNKMLSLGHKKTLKLFYDARHMLLIDKSVIGNKKATIKAVKHFYIAEE